jgi:predicted ferric reductase
MNCQAGQFVFLQFLGPNVPSEWHPFSLSAINDDSSIEVVVKKLGDYTKLIDVICPSMTVRVEGPYGRFYDSKIPTSQIWIAGGIGITPFLAMAKRLSTTTSVDLYYIVHSREEAVGYQTLIEVVRAHANFRLFVYDTTQAKSRITATMIQQTSGALQDRDIYICGPPPMMKSLTQQLKQLNVSGRRIHSEEFSMS